ncbi:MAG: hypothetical protein AAB116_14380, partial [Candidatus Poribacteria bacterium]
LKRGIRLNSPLERGPGVCLRAYKRLKTFLEVAYQIELLIYFPKLAYGDAFHFKSLRHTGKLPFDLWFSTHSQQKPCLSQSLLLHVHFSLLISILGHCARFFESLDGNIFTTFLSKYV